MLSDVIKLAIEENKRNRSLFPETKKVYDKSQWLCNFCTIHINVGRGSGKTDYIQYNLKDNDIAIFPSRRMSIVSPLDKSKIYSNLDELKDAFYGDELDNVEYVYIDEPKMSFNVFGEDEIYNIFSGCEGEPTFILLGE
jgi:hypothetical protein